MASNACHLCSAFAASSDDSNRVPQGVEFDFLHGHHPKKSALISLMPKSPTARFGGTDFCSCLFCLRQAAMLTVSTPE